MISALAVNEVPARLGSFLAFDFGLKRTGVAVGNRLTRTTLPDGHVVRMQPMAVDVPGARTELGFPPKYGADTARVLTEAGYSADEVDALRSKGVVA